MPRTQTIEERAKEISKAYAAESLRFEFTADITVLDFPLAKSFRNHHNLKMFVAELLHQTGFVPTVDTAMWEHYARTFLKFPELVTLGQFIKDARERYIDLTENQRPRRVPI